jgi:predicted RND superfamily exporter protein
MLALTLVLGSGMGQLRFETSTDSYLDSHDPDRIRYDEFRAQYVNDDTLLVLLHSEEIFSFEFLERLRALHEELENSTFQTFEKL